MKLCLPVVNRVFATLRHRAFVTLLHVVVIVYMPTKILRPMKHGPAPTNTPPENHSGP
jgi:hypothetical protein